MGTPGPLLGAQMRPSQWSLEVAREGAGQGQGVRVAGLTGQVHSWVSRPGFTPGICQYPPQLPLPHNSVIYVLKLWAVSPMCPGPASMGTSLGSILIWLHQALPSAKALPWGGWTGSAAVRMVFAVWALGKSDGKAGLHGFN